jgi:hypothetical protein
VDSTIISSSDDLKLQVLDPDSYVVIMKKPSNIIDTILDGVVLSSIGVKPKRKYKNGA